MTEHDLGHKLDVIASILKLVHREQLDAVRSELAKEPAKTMALALASDWTAAGDLVRAVMSKTKKSERSVQVYLGELVSLGVLERQGSGRSTAYRATGVL